MQKLELALDFVHETVSAQSSNLQFLNLDFQKIRSNYFESLLVRQKFERFTFW